MFILLVLVLLFPNSVYAQTSNELYQKYLQSAGEYRTSHNAYQLAKNQHTQYHTGATQIEAINKTNAVLAKRNTLFTEYLRYLRTRLAEVTNIADYAQTVVYLDLETEINYLMGLTDLGSGDTFNKINDTSESWQNRALSTETLIRASQIQIALTNLETLQTRFNLLFDEYKTSHATPSADQQITLTQIDALISQTNSLKNNTNNAVKNYKSTSFSAESSFKNLDTAKSHLLEAATLLNGLTIQ